MLLVSMIEQCAMSCSGTKNAQPAQPLRHRNDYPQKLSGNVRTRHKSVVRRNAAVMIAV
jgi:hypothetical protein